MIFSWSQFVEIAEYLKEQGEAEEIPQEAAYRCAVSRAYYGAYRYAQNYAKESWGYAPKSDGTDHKQVRTFFEKKEMMSISRNLRRLHQWRKECDYNEPFEEYIDLSHCLTDSISVANTIITALKQ